MGARRLKTVREQKGYSQAELARLIRVDQSMIVRMEQGTRRPGRRIAARLDRILGQTIYSDHELGSR